MAFPPLGRIKDAYRSMQATLLRAVNDLDSTEEAPRHSGELAYGLRRLRAALRGDAAIRGASAAARERAEVDAFVESLRRPLLRYCEGLVRQSGGIGRSVALATDRHVDADDLAQEVWTKTLRYLAGSGGDRVADDEHFRRLLRRTAKTIYLDRMTKGGAPSHILELDAPLVFSTGTGAATGEGEERALRDTLAAPRAAVPAELLFLDDERYAPLIEILFSDPERFHRTYRRKHQRRPRQYQAFVLYQLGIFFRVEAVSADARSKAGAASADTEEGAQLMQELIEQYVTLLGIPEAMWQPVARAATLSGERSAAEGDADGSGFDERIMEAVNAVCGTNVRAANMLAVLRYELNQFVEWEKEGAR